MKEKGENEIRSGFFEIEIEIKMNGQKKWKSIPGGPYWFGVDREDDISEARKKATERLAEKLREDPNQSYRISIYKVR